LLLTASITAAAADPGYYSSGSDRDPNKIATRNIQLAF
jgi:hypothetical protein